MPPPRPRILFPSFRSTSNSSNGNELHPLRRHFTTSLPVQALGPESPNYIAVPKPVQPTFPPKPTVKGVLPVPRNVFLSRAKQPKESSKFLDAATKEPTADHRIPQFSKDADRILYKRKLAESRRQALRVGITGLHERKVEIEKRIHARSARLEEEHIRLVNAPERETDRLTNPSISKPIRDLMENKLPNSVRKTPQRVARYERLQAKKAAVRQDYLHTLYVNARDFIIDEKQLDQAIDKAFGTSDQPVGWYTDGAQAVGAPGKSVWTGGTPDSVKDILEERKAGETGFADGGYTIAGERMRRIAEGLTGGKM